MDSYIDTIHSSEPIVNDSNRDERTTNDNTNHALEHDTIETTNENTQDSLVTQITPIIHSTMQDDMITEFNDMRNSSREQENSESLITPTTQLQNSIESDIIIQINDNNPIDNQTNDLPQELGIIEIHTNDVLDTIDNTELDSELIKVDEPTQNGLTAPGIGNVHIPDPDPDIPTPNDLGTPDSMDDVKIDILDNFDPDSLTTANFRASRRSSITKSLDFEKFTFNIYKSENQAGMITNDPIIWTKALQMYTKNKNVSCRWEICRDKNENKCTEFKLHLTFMETKRITISVKLVTGIISIKGIHHKQWIESEFDYVKRYVDILKTNATPLLAQTTNPTNLEDTDKTVTNPSTEGIVKGSVTEKGSNIMNQIDMLWEENVKLRNAFKTLETSLIAKPPSMDDKNNKISEMFENTLTEKLKETEKRLDAKIVLFQEELEKAFQTKIKSLEQSLSHRLSNLREKITKLNTDLEDEANGAHYSIKSECNKLHEIVNSHIKSCSHFINPAPLGTTRSHPVIENNEDLHGTTPTDNEYPHTQTSDNENRPIPTQDNDLVESKLQFTVSSEHEIPCATEDVQDNTIIAELPHLQRANDTSHSPQSGHSAPKYSDDDRNTLPSTNTINASKNPPIDYTTELIIMIDSNIKFIEHRKLWTIKNTKFRQCGHLDEVERTINEKTYTNLKYVLVNVGCNDTDENSGTSVFNRISEIIQNTKKKYNDIKIILAEITPRKDERDSEGVKFNQLINQFAQNSENIYVAKHENLRDEKNGRENNRFLYDDKHIKKNCIGRFAKNLKIALSKAYGLDDTYQQHHRNLNQESDLNRQYQRHEHQRSDFSESYMKNWDVHHQTDHLPNRENYPYNNMMSYTGPRTNLLMKDSEGHRNTYHCGDIDMGALKMTLKKLLTMVDG